MTTFRSLISALIAVGIAASALSACNTVEGVGKDIKNAGKKVEEVAKDNK